MSLLESLTNYLVAESKTVKKAPAIFVATLVVGGIAGFYISGWHYDELVTFLREENTSYKEKLNGASPDQAAQQMIALKTNIAKLEHDLIEIKARTLPRRISDDQRPRVLSILTTAQVKPKVVIFRNMTSADGHAYSLDWEGVLSEAGWSTEERMGITATEHVGIVVKSKDAAGLVSLQSALEAAGEKPSVEVQGFDDVATDTIELIIGNRD